MDTTVSGVVFDENGECNFCKVHDGLEERYPLDARGKESLTLLMQRIKHRGKRRKYDCIIGVSGGRDSTYTLYLAKKVYGLRPLAVHFNDGFGNPVAGENMIRATEKLGVDLRTITSDWRESKDLKLSFLKASTPDLEQGTDVGIATALYGRAARENIKYIFLGRSFRTEGIAPLSWNYLDGKYLKAVHRLFGTIPLRKWTPDDPGFNLTVFHMFYYTLWRRLRVISFLYYVRYVISEVEKILESELDWVYPGAKYFDDLYQSLMTYILRVKFKIDRRLYFYSALVRSGQMERPEALRRVKEVYSIEDPKILDLCVKRLGITRTELSMFLSLPPKTFHDYPNHYSLIKKLRPLVRFLSQTNLLPASAYDKYFHCGN
ncbi:MAG: N-acetyl sugar amidotransferase [Candidatus Omnitrophica bacterium]|nr:N-acetyl sugar amidotransferase [Candidatus Omnitrophota bacterium]